MLSSHVFILIVLGVLVSATSPPPLPLVADFVAEWTDSLDSGVSFYDTSNQRVRTDYHEEGRSIIDLCLKGLRYELRNEGGLTTCQFTNITCEVVPFGPPEGSRYYPIVPERKLEEPSDVVHMWRFTFMGPSSELGLVEYMCEFFYRRDGAPSHFANSMRAVMPPGVKSVVYSLVFKSFEVRTPPSSVFTVPNDLECTFVDPGSCPFAAANNAWGGFVPTVQHKNEQDNAVDHILADFGIF